MKDEEINSILDGDWDGQQERASTVLDYVLETESDEAIAERNNSVTVSSALSANKLIEVEESRSKTRVLFITNSSDIYETDGTTQKYYQELSHVFDEVHVLVITERGKEIAPKKIGNLFIYSVAGRHLWSICFNARRIVSEHLTFGGMIRPDVVVSLDPYISGICGFVIARMLERPWQVHVSEDPYDVVFLYKDKKNKVKRRMANFVFKRVESVRTSTEFILQQVTIRFKKMKDARVLPRYYHFEVFAKSQPLFHVHEKYSQYSFVMLTQADLFADSTLHDVIAAVRQLLLSPKIGLIVIGDGPAKQLFEEKAKILQIEKNIIFLPTTTDVVSLYKTSDVYIEGSTKPSSEENIFKAIGANIPIVAYATDQRKDLLVEGESAFLCEPGDSFALGKAVSKILNSSALRIQFKQRTKEIATFRIHENKDDYFLSLKDSIESVFAIKD